MYVVAMRDCTPDAQRARGIQITGVRATVAGIYDTGSEPHAGRATGPEAAAAAARCAAEYAAARQGNGCDRAEHDQANRWEMSVQAAEAEDCRGIPPALDGFAR
jgi:hypothetical protein